MRNLASIFASSRL